MKTLNRKLEEELHQNIVSIVSLGGGCIGNANKVTVKDGTNYFVKQYLNSKIHFAEANGLNELKRTNTIRIPEVIKVNKDFLILEFIESASKSKNFSNKFGRQFAEMHKTHNPKFGYVEDNFIGSTTQKNLPESDSWTDFYFQNRILFQYKLVEKNGYANSELKSGISYLGQNIDKILNGSEEPPTLLHGDLWGGNYITDEQGNPCLIDPAVYFGHREADLAMTKLFGGFDSVFYQAYNEAYPLKDGWKYRENIYKLYHILNHLNLFGSGYLSQALSLINSYR
ncbi:MAG: fructosamine kinase [Ignavibacteriae bacterium]|nr:MAG: fructosamine kinase [Ignavibacteriota bacterium]